MQFDTIRRRADGSIDYDLYHNRALTLRAETMTGFFKPFAAVKKPLLLVTVIAAVFIAVRPDQFVG